MKPIIIHSIHLLKKKCKHSFENILEKRVGIENPAWFDLRAEMCYNHAESRVWF